MSENLTAEERKLVAEALAMLPAGPWTVASSNSFRRINGPDGKDGGVLHAYAQRSDGHPDLSMSELVLWALCRVVNATPGLLTALEEAEGRAKANEHDAQVWMAHAEKAEQMAAAKDEALRNARYSLVQARMNARDTPESEEFTQAIDEIDAAISPSKSEAANDLRS